MVLQWQKGLDFLCRWEEDWNKDCVGSGNNVQRDACIEKPQEEIWASGLLWSHKGKHWCGEPCINWCFDEDQNEAMDTECQLLSPQYSQNQCQKPLWQSEQEEFVQFQVHLVTRQIVGGTFLVSASQEAIGLPKNIVNKMKRVIGSDEESVPAKKKNVGVEQEKCAQRVDSAPYSERNSLNHRLQSKCDVCGDFVCPTYEGYCCFMCLKCENGSR